MSRDVVEIRNYLSKNHFSKIHFPREIKKSKEVFVAKKDRGKG